MSFASSIRLAVECCSRGIVGGWQGGRATDLEDFKAYLSALDDVDGAIPVVNLPARIAEDPHGAAKLDLLEQHRAPLVLSSVGDPTTLVSRVHGWGGRVVHDVTTMRHAEKAIAAGADGLMLTCAGAGGHTGFLSPLAFVPAVRRRFDGLLIVGGGIADASGMAAALALGADLACMGTRFIATPESGVMDGHRAMIEEAEIDEIVVSAAMNGVPANWLTSSIRSVGLDPLRLPAIRTPTPAKPWREIWSAGHSVGLIESIEPVSSLVERLIADLEKSSVPDWRGRLAHLDAIWQRAGPSR